MEFGKYLAGIIFLVLLFWDPFDNWPGSWWIVHIGYAVAFFLIIRLTLWLIWSRWPLGPRLENILGRSLTIIVFVSFVALAVIKATAKSHLGNTRWVQTHEGMDAIGEDIILPGPDWYIVLFLVTIAGFIFWFGILKKGSKNKSS